MKSAVRKRPPAIIFLQRWWTVLLLPLSGALVLAARRNPALTEKWYSGGLYPLLAKSVGRITSLLPFSLMELLLCTLAVSALVMLVMCIVRTAKAAMHRGAPVRTDWKALLERLVKLVCCILFLFVILCGLNYYRPEFAVFSGLTLRESTVQELAALCADLARRAGDLRENMGLDENESLVLAGSYSELAVEARTAIGLLAEDYSVLPELPIKPKPVINSWAMSMMQITGVFTPFTYEANVNIAAPDYTIPATMCHELAHTRGFMREDEANFIAYLACQKSDSALFRYSGVMLALVHSMNRLYSADLNAYLQVSGQFSEGVRRDFAYNNAYWARYEGPVAEISNAVNDTYLKVNNQTDGVHSYGRMVDLLLADYREHYDLLTVPENQSAL